MTRPAVEEPWYSVRCLFAFEADDGLMYEERVTIWRTESFQAAIEMAELEAHEYARTLEGTYLGLAQAFHLGVDDRQLEDGDEVFSLMRVSDLGPDEYVTRFFATGREHQRHMD